MPKVKTVSLSDLDIDPTVNIRKKLDKQTVEHYRSILSSLPPITVFDTEDGLVVADGFHRLEATRIEGFDAIKAEVHAGRRDDALHYAAIANLKHGKPLSGEERRAVVRRLKELHPTWGKVQIAKETGWSEWTVKDFLDEDIVRKTAAKSVGIPTDLKPSTYQEIAKYAQKKDYAPLVEAAAKHDWGREEVRVAAKQVSAGDRSVLKTGIPTAIENGQVAVSKETLSRMGKKRKQADLEAAFLIASEKLYGLSALIDKHGLSGLDEVLPDDRPEYVKTIDRHIKTLNQIRDVLAERRLEAVR